MDRYGLDIYLPTEQRQATVLALLEKGHADRMFLSQDWCSTLDYFTAEFEEQIKPVAAPNWSMTFLFEQVIPELKERGMSEEQLDQMMVENPKRWLA
jgi:phosphotriesterase-related protein